MHNTGILFRLRLTIKFFFDKIRNDKLKRSILQAIPFWAASILTGLIAVLYAKLFSFAEQASVYIYTKFGIYVIVFTPLSFLFSWWVVKKYAPAAKGSGIPQVMAAIELSTPKTNFLVKNLLSVRILIVKIVSSLGLVLGGGAIGREGPTIQIAASIFKKVNDSLPGWWPKSANKNMIVTGAAAGLAAAFNTPLGGIVFAIEELTKLHISFFRTALFSAVIIAGITAQSILGSYLYLGVPSVKSGGVFAILGVLTVAIVSGLAASLMCKIILKLFAWKKTFKKQYSQILYLLIGSLIISVIAYTLNVEIFGSGKEIMNQFLFTNEKYSNWYTPFLRILGPIISFTVGAAGGVFAPALSAGATIGSFVYHFLGLTNLDPNMLILAGMVGFLTGVTRTPFTSTILVLEMTDKHNLIFQLMLAAVVANLVSMFIDKNSFYDHLKHEYINENLQVNNHFDLNTK